MRHVPVAEFENKVAEFLAAAEAGEEITIAMPGRGSVRLVGGARDRVERRRAAVDAAYVLGQEIKAKYGPTSPAEIRTWIDEGRP